MNRLGLLAGLIPLCALSLFGQAFYGSIVGSVTDQSNAAVRGASVTLTNVETDERHQTLTGDFGGYQDSTNHPSESQYPNPKRIIFTGAAVFGGVEIKN